MEHHLKHRRRQPAQDGMGPDGIVEDLDVGENGGLDVASGLKTAQMDQLAFQAAKE